MKLIIATIVILGISGIFARPSHDIERELFDLEANDTTAVTSVTITSIPDMTTNPIITIEPVTSNNMTTETPATVEPITFTEPTATTVVTPATLSVVPSNPSTPSTPKTTNTSPKITASPPEKETGFDGGSFGGGIALGLGLCIIFFIAWKIYATRKSSRGYNTM